jgi:hypothetical protein
MLCGMTRAFIKCSEFEFAEAIKLNIGSIYLYSFLILNFLFFIFYAIYKINLFKLNI